MSIIRSVPLAGLLLCAACLGQSPDSVERVAIEPRVHAARPEAIRHATFRLDVKLVQIPVTVTDVRDRPVLGLAESSFRVFEDDVEQHIAAFSMGDAAISAGLVFDSSGSMRHHIGESREAVSRFLNTAVPGDEFFLVRFSDDPQLVTPFTPDPGAISLGLRSVQPRGWTAMNDAIVRSLEEMRRAANPRRVLLVLTDGVDNNSRYSDAELLSLVREGGAGLFAIGLFERAHFLEKMAEETGGRVIWVHKIAQLPEAIERLSLEIRNQYVVSYFSDHAANDGRYHKVRVEVQPPPALAPVRVSWRRGYTAP